MRRGGVAKTYTTYEAAGAPKQVDKKWYIDVRHPKTGNIKTVRWYTDLLHDGMKPIDFARYVSFPGKRFHFEDEDDWVWTIDKRWLTDEEARLMFGHEKGWYGSALFGPNFGTKDEWWKVGCWYADRLTELPDIKAKDRFKKRTWKEWVEECVRLTAEDGVFKADDCFWGDILEDLKERRPSMFDE